MDRRLQPLSFISWSHAFWIVLLTWFTCSPVNADTTEVTQSVWANEAIVSAYTFADTTLLPRQKIIAQYFTAQGWINFSKALDTAKLKESVQENHYTVSAVSLLPPRIKPLPAKGEWQATMPLMVLYKNKEYQQKQTLSVVITVVPAKPGTGVRGYAITSFTSTVTTPACQCENQHGTKTIV